MYNGKKFTFQHEAQFKATQVADACLKVEIR